METELKESLDALRNKLEDKVVQEITKEKADLQKQFDEWQVKQKSKGTGRNTKTFEDALGEALKAKEADLKRAVDSKSVSLNFTLKAAGDENFDFSNFATGAYDKLTTENQGLYQSPFSPAWLRAFLPNATTQSGTIYYPKYTGSGDGAVGVWDGTDSIDELASKPGVNFDIEDVTENVM